MDRKQFEEKEAKFLASYAVKSNESRGRQFEEPEDFYRTCFQRDRDRVIHSRAFRRLRGKTQVFIASYGDHYRSRLAHSIEVAQISRDLARMLELNEDLVETIGLAHDLGHTPFGHAGQDEMHEIMQGYGSRFEHNEQSLRVVDVLEDKKPDHKGLNLSFEVRDGLMKHRTTFDQPEITDTLMPSIEAQIVNLADEIAYMNHDIDDALRSNILKVEDFESLAIWQYIKEDLHGNSRYDAQVIISSLMSTMINRLAAHTMDVIKTKGITSATNVYKTAAPIADFPEEIKKQAAELKTFLYKNFYQSKGVAEYNEKGKEVIRFLFEKLYNDPALLPEEHQEGDELHILVKDYIAGMTDNFALELYKKLQ